MSIKTILKQIIPNFILGYRIKYFKKNIDQDQIRYWKKQGCPAPPPEIIKRRKIKSIQSKFKYKILIETGTYLGDMINYQINNFKYLYTIELSEDLFIRATERFKEYNHVKTIQGDSGIELKKLMKTITESCIFWLDGHYSGVFNGVQTAKGEKDSPIFKELEAICKTPYNHFILIDDARLFNGTNDYPTLDELSKYILANRPNSKISIETDIILIEFVI